MRKHSGAYGKMNEFFVGLRMSALFLYEHMTTEILFFRGGSFDVFSVR